MKQAEERVVSPEDLSNDDHRVEIVKVPMDDKGSVMFIGSLSADEYVEWAEAKSSDDPDVKRNAAALLMMRSLVKGPVPGDDATPEQRKAAAVRTGTDAHVKAFRKAKVSRTERLLKAILKLNYINQRDEATAKNG